MSVVVEYLPVESFVHSLNPLTKIFGALSILIVSLLFTNPLYLAGVFVVVVSLAGVARVLQALAGSLKGLFIFAFILFFLEVLFYNEGAVYFHLIPIGGGYLSVTQAGVLLGIAMGLRMLTIVTSFLLFLATTRTQDFLTTLVETLKVSADMAFMILTSIRFIPTFLQELKQISDAQRSRAFVNEGWNPVRKVKAYLPIAVPLVLMSLKKTQQMVLAMETRGYGLGPRSHLRELTIKRTDKITMLFLVSLICVGILIRVKGYGGLV